MIRLLSIADILSIGNAIFGVFAIFVLFSDYIGEIDFRIHLSFSFILIALLIDGIDGIIARKTHKSEIGEYLESMADMTSLGIAPAVFIYIIYSDLISCNNLRLMYLFFALILLIAFGIIRLASFHLMKEDKVFVGLPASASTIILIVMGFFNVKFVYILPSIIIIAAAMICNVRFPKPGIKFNAVAAVLIVFAIILGKNFYGIGPWLLFSAIIIYSIGGPIYVKFLN
jgi:CDP-diacylglycerol--serine O-phosphatidyltransferase